MAVTVLGRDRPGIVAAVTEVLAGLGANIEDSSMTRLRGTFAMTLVLGLAASAEDVAAALRPPAERLGLRVEVQPVEPGGDTPAGAPHVLTLHGADRPGIVAAVAGLLARAGGNVTDLTTRLSGTLYVLVCDVDLPPATDVSALAAEVQALGVRLGVTAALRPAEGDAL